MRVSKVDVVVLGCLAEAPCHGYELLERMRAVGTGASVAKASVYQCLRRLEHAGLVAGRAQEGIEGPGRRVFRITGAGRKRLAEGLKERFADPAPFQTEAGVALGFVHLLGPAAARRAIEARARGLNELKDAVRTERAGSAGALEGSLGGADAMRDRQLRLADAELAWLHDLHTNLSQGRR